MGVNGKLGFSLAFIAMLILLLATKSIGAAAAYQMDSRIADDMETEFMMDSEISRTLAGGIPLTGATLNQNKAVANCGRPGAYRPCIGGNNKNKIGEHCTYASNNRACK